MDAVVCERLKAVVLSSSLLMSGGDSAPGCGPLGAGPELPAHRPLAIVCVAEGWGQAAGLWERISGPGLASSRQKLLIKDIPGMTEPSMQDAPPPQPARPAHAAAAAGASLVTESLSPTRRGAETHGGQASRRPWADGLGGMWGARHCSWGPQGPGGTSLWNYSLSCLLRAPRRAPPWSRPGTDSPWCTPPGPGAFLPRPGWRGAPWTPGGPPCPHLLTRQSLSPPPGQSGRSLSL